VSQLRDFLDLGVKEVWGMGRRMALFFMCGKNVG
jgi:hypothetical protein